MNTILIGAQWGDEGKGKIIDVLTEEADIVVRTQGGNNAGHTVFLGPKKYVLHLIPSGILRPGKQCVIGNGVVLDPIGLVGEIDGLLKLGIRIRGGKRGNLVVSETAHVVFPWHRELDGLGEQRKGSKKIGTTKRGIGPTYGDKAARVGLRVVDLIQRDRLAATLRERLRENNAVIRALGGKVISYRKLLAEYSKAADRLRPFVANTVVLLHEATNAKRRILFEGAQGTFLDIDHGTYPFVTSSNTTSGGACTGSGVPPNRMDRVVGVMKAYTTRVGEGPLPTENAEISDLLHGMGREFGATTGRARRCGWFDAVATRHATMVNGIDELAITNIDGLDTVEEIKVCTGYRLNRSKIQHMPADCEALARCQPVYETFPGWLQPTHEITRFRDLPIKSQTYLAEIARLTGAKLRIASVGPAREQTMFL
ncbi:MAG: adenylosuccinate synthase [Pedosphaera sp.]|nr:adenylosuccinate synthase [Pedosphaera sp.]